MSRIITKKRTKELVREISKRESDAGVHLVREMSIFYDGVDKFSWIRQGNEPRGYRDLMIPMRAAYVEKEDGSLVQRKLGELDELIYQAINDSNIARDYKKIMDFKLKRQVGLNQSLKYMNIGIQEDRDRGEDYLYIFYRNEPGSPKPDKEDYKNLDGVGMGKRFEDFLTYRGYSIKGIENKSEELGMFIRVSNIWIESWEDLIEAAKEFDYYLRFE